ncbi:MAG: polysaccharide deacetylase family protein [Kiritimatiellae bacterium]|nr:polysaccharide deacetylase family protein [Kiritimatiellia bacterium]
MNRNIFYGTLGVLAAIAVIAGGVGAFRREAGKSRPVPVLMYHEVGDKTNSAWCVPAKIFRSQMSSLREQGFQTILPSDLAAHRKWRRPLPRRPIIITFDDGYLCNLTRVEPILNENGFRAIIYLITGRVAETAAERRQYEGKDCLVWPEALAMQKRRTFVFGGHSHTHANLVVDANPAWQMAECRRQLILHGIKKPHSFSYPHGEYNEKTIQAAREAGFQTAVVCQDAVTSIGPGANLLALPRVSVMGGSHEFRFLENKPDAGGKALLCRVSHTGIPIEITAGLRGNGNAPDIWLPAREVSRGDFELRFALPDDPAGPGHGLVEIWDKHRLFKLATAGAQKTDH